MNEVMNEQKYQEARQLFGNVPTPEFEKKVDDLRNNQLSPNTKLNGQTYNTGDVTMVAADELMKRYIQQNPKYYLRDTKLSQDDLQKQDMGGSSDWVYIIASMEQMNDASISPEAEYREWVKTEKEIRQDIYSNGTTQEEVDRRNGFIGFLNERDIELSRVIELYQATMFSGSKEYKEKAAVKLKFLLFKRSELLRLKESMMNTKSRADRKKENYFEERMKEEMVNTALGSKVEDFFNGYHPITMNVHDAERKVEKLLEANPRLVFTLMRQGMSKEEIRRHYIEMQKTGGDKMIAHDIFERGGNRRVGFTVNGYNSNSRSA